jgi:hypothetical protein
LAESVPQFLILPETMTGSLGQADALFACTSVSRTQGGFLQATETVSVSVAAGGQSPVAVARTT